MSKVLGQYNPNPHTLICYGCIFINTAGGSAKLAYVIRDEMILVDFSGCRIHFRRSKTGSGVWELIERTSKLKIIPL